MENDWILTISVAALHHREVGSPGLSLAAACLRLLLNSRDELSLARALTDSGLVQPAQFSAMRRGGKPGSPLYQAVLSFLRQVELGGRSYQVSRDQVLIVFVVIFCF